MVKSDRLSIDDRLCLSIEPWISSCGTSGRWTSIADEGTFGRAAGRLGYTQSTVSQQIATLERAVGGPVFDRPGGPRAVRLTPLGELVLRARSPRAPRRRRARRRPSSGSRPAGGRIDIGTFQSVSTVILPSLVSRLQCRAPGLRGAALRGGAGGSPDRRPRHALLRRPHRRRRRVREAPGRPLRPRGAPRRLRRRPGAGWPTSTAGHGGVAGHLRPAADGAGPGSSGAHPRIVFRSASNEALLSMVRFGLGFAILPKLAVTGAVIDDHLRSTRSTFRCHARCTSPARNRSLSPLAVRRSSSRERSPPPSDDPHRSGARSRLAW